MNKVSQNAIKSLLETEDSATMSIYLPTHRFPTSEYIQEDKIRLKNLVRGGKEILAEKGVDDGLIEQIVLGIEDGLYDDESFWQKMTEGVAIFCSPAGVHYFYLPMECDEKVSAGDGYDIVPLLAAASYDQPYYLLVLAKHRPILYKGDMYGVERVAINLPESPEAALNIDESHSNSKTDRVSGAPGTKAHGQGDSRQAGQEERLKYFRMIDDILQSDPNIDQSSPLLLAGTDDEVSGYRDSSRARSLLESSISGNYTETPIHELHAKSWPIISNEICDRKREEEIERLNSLIGTGKASAGAEDIVAAAEEGRVDTLLVGLLTTTRDSVSDGEDPVVKMVFSDDYESSDVAACGRSVFSQGGSILAVSKDAMPGGVPIAVIYRY